MPISHAEQQSIEKAVAAASTNQRKLMRSEAEISLTHLNRRMAERILFLEERDAAQKAIEVLVRMDAIEQSGGWWYRLKRRMQLTNRYLSRPAATPWSQQRKELNGTAVELMKLTDLALTKYLPMSEDSLMAALSQDFPPDCYGLDLDAITIVFPQMPDFYFTLSENSGSKSLCVTGRKRYSGFTLFAPDRGHWHCHAQDAITYAATGAKALASVLERKFGIRDMTHALSLKEPFECEAPVPMLRAA